MFRSLTLKNFKKHAELTVNFTAGMNGVYGPNYKGKSTILYGLLFALGGTSHVPGTRLANRDSDGRYSVEAEFEASGELLRVVRTKSTANLYVGGASEPFATGTTGVNKEIEKRIGMTVAQWKELHYAKQKNAHSLLRYSAGNLHALMRRLVGAEELDQVQKRLKRMGDKESGVLEALQAPAFTLEQIAEEIEKIDSQVAELKDKASEAQIRVQELGETELQGVEKIKGLNTRLQQLATAKGEAETMRARLESAERGKEQAVEANAARLKEWEDAEQALEKLVASEDPGAGEKIALYEQAVNRVNLARAAVPAAEERLRKAQEGLDQVRQAVSGATLALEAAPAPDTAAILEDQNKQADLRGEVAVINQKIKDLEAALEGAECPTCHRPFEEHNPEDLATELRGAKEQRRTLVEQGQALGEKITSAQGAATKAAAAKRTLEIAESQVQLQENTLLNEQLRVQEAEVELKDATQQLGELGLDEEKVAALRSQSQTLGIARQTAAKAKAEWQRTNAAQDSAMVAWETISAKGPFADPAEIDAEVAKRQATLNKDQATLSELRVALSEARAEELAATQQLGTANSQRKVWVERGERVEADSGRRAKAEARLAKIQHLQKHLKANAEGYMGKVWGSFLAQASGIVRQCTGGDVQGLQRNDDGAFEFVEEGAAMALDEASGAQEAIIGLAVQLALSTAAPCHLNVLLLDEPTADMDPDCSLATLMAMRAMGQQVIFVSHHQEDNSLCDNAINL